MTQNTRIMFLDKVGVCVCVCLGRRFGEAN